MAVLTSRKTWLQMGDGAEPSEAFATIAQRVSIDAPEISREAVEIDDLDTEGALPKRASAVYDPGELSLSGNYDPSAHEDLEELAKSGEIVNWRLVFNNGTSSRPHRQFPGFVSSFQGGNAEGDNNLAFEMTLTLTGEIETGTTTVA